MGRSAEDWHRRFRQQAGWTSQARTYLLGKARLGWRGRILEVGCGTGAITTLLHIETRLRIYGVDINREFLRLAAVNDPQTRFCAGDGLALSFARGSFDLAVCHFFLLWIARPDLAIAEMARVTRPGGWVIAFAEPDYGGRIDAPADLERLGDLQAESLRKQGAATNRGRELAALFQGAELTHVETGVLGGQWQKRGNLDEIEAEWAILEEDLDGMIPTEDLRRMKEVNGKAWDQGSRVLFVPTFYGMGKVRSS
jgi:SAM-dependent methyltransferase